MQLKLQFRFFCQFLAFAFIMAACATTNRRHLLFRSETDAKASSRNLNSNQVPLFVSFGSDDNPYSGLRNVPEEKAASTYSTNSIRNA